MRDDYPKNEIMKFLKKLENVATNTKTDAKEGEKEDICDKEIVPKLPIDNSAIMLLGKKMQRIIAEAIIVAKEIEETLITKQV